MQSYFDIANPSKNAVLHFGLHLVLISEKEQNVALTVNYTIGMSALGRSGFYRINNDKYVGAVYRKFTKWSGEGALKIPNCYPYLCG